METEDKELSTLKYIFENVNKWLTHAEAKHAAVLAVNISLVATLGIKIKTLFLLVVIIVQFILFLPKFNSKKSNKNENKNLIYFKYIATKDKDAYIKELKYDYKFNMSNKLSQDICEEIIINSRICTKKYENFIIIIFLEIIGILILISPSLLNILSKFIYM